MSGVAFPRLSKNYTLSVTVLKVFDYNEYSWFKYGGKNGKIIRNRWREGACQR